MGDGKETIFPLPWPCGSFRAARRDACAKLRQVAPSLRIPPGAFLAVEFVFIPPSGRTRKLNEWLSSWCDATLRGLIDCFHTPGLQIRESRRVAKVPTPGGEVLVKVRVIRQ